MLVFNIKDIVQVSVELTSWFTETANHSTGDLERIYNSRALVHQGFCLLLLRKHTKHGRGLTDCN